MAIATVTEIDWPIALRGLVVCTLVFVCVRLAGGEGNGATFLGSSDFRMHVRTSLYLSEVFVGVDERANRGSPPPCRSGP
uniref:Putative secreted protein n=1 Tax=Ixodes ricinus TaxID=34613 RepID=A0A6B0U1I9_IXORI